MLIQTRRDVLYVKLIFKPNNIILVIRAHDCVAECYLFLYWLWNFCSILKIIVFVSMAICWFQMFPNDITCKIDIMCFHINIESNVCLWNNYFCPFVETSSFVLMTHVRLLTAKHFQHLAWTKQRRIRTSLKRKLWCLHNQIFAQRAPTLTTLHGSGFEWFLSFWEMIAIQGTV